MSEYLLLKWGTLKGWNLESDKSLEAAQKYADMGMALGAMQQRDTPEQKQALCELIDAIDGEITNDWSGEVMSKDEAKKYEIAWTSLLLIRHDAGDKETVRNISKFAIENARTNTEKFRKQLAEDIGKLLKE